MTIRPVRPMDHEKLVQLIAGFRDELRSLRGRAARVDLQGAAQEFAGHMASSHPIFIAESDQGDVVGYLICRAEDAVVWAESLYVSPAHRRRGIASSLYAEAERLGEELGGDTVYNWVHPNNDAIIHFLVGIFVVKNPIRTARAAHINPDTGVSMPGKMGDGVRITFRRVIVFAIRDVFEHGRTRLFVIR